MMRHVRACLAIAAVCAVGGMVAHHFLAAEPAAHGRAQQGQDGQISVLRNNDMVLRVGAGGRVVIQQGSLVLERIGGGTLDAGDMLVAHAEALDGVQQAVAQLADSTATVLDSQAERLAAVEALLRGLAKRPCECAGRSVRVPARVLVARHAPGA